ncbi:MAG: hypothetical protein D6790_14675, partial [Caldilineae bacterium]
MPARHTHTHGRAAHRHTTGHHATRHRATHHRATHHRATHHRATHVYAHPVRRDARGLGGLRGREPGVHLDPPGALDRPRRRGAGR